jgi:serine/threonine protein kinase
MLVKEFACAKTKIMEGNSRCRRCNAELLAQAVDGLCANCLLSLALEPREETPHRLGAGGDERSAPDDYTGPSAEHCFGDYQLLEMIGRGGMGVVYKARQKHLNRLVALKMVQNWRDASLDTLARFQIEAKAAAKLDHPNIVPTYQIGELNGQPFFSMKLVAGASLSKKIRELALVKPGNGSEPTPPLRPAREAQVLIASLLARVARAVHYAHLQGVIHRDLKPSNILIDPAGEPHLTDFGVAKLLEHDIGLTRTHEMLGTPAYMAPEQAAGNAISPAVDIYSLGAILYELLTGQPPFRGKSPLETLRKAAEEEPVPPSTMNGSTDAELAAICLKCLEKNPMHRYGSALGVAEDLERWIRREPIRAKHAGPFSRAMRWTRRNPVGASLIGTLCAGLIGVLLLLGWVYGVNDKIAAMLQEMERSQRGEARKMALLVSLVKEELETLWPQKDRKVLRISSEQLAALSGSEGRPPGTSAFRIVGQRESFVGLLSLHRAVVPSRTAPEQTPGPSGAD